MEYFWNGGQSLVIIGVFLRATILYFSLLVMTRFMGHRQVAIVAAFNFIVQAGMSHMATFPVWSVPNHLW